MNLDTKLRCGCTVDEHGKIILRCTRTLKPTTYQPPTPPKENS